MGEYSEWSNTQTQIPMKKMNINKINGGRKSFCPVYVQQHYYMDWVWTLDAYNCTIVVDKCAQFAK